MKSPMLHRNCATEIRNISSIEARSDFKLISECISPFADLAGDLAKANAR